MTYDFAKLVGKIGDVYGNQENFAIDMKISAHTISKKLNGKSPWKIPEAHRAVELLKIPKKKIPEYFFTQKVTIMQQTKESA